MEASSTHALIPGNCVRTARRRFNRGWAFWCCAGLALWGLCATFAWSDEAIKPGTSGVLLLEGNRVVQGRITPQGETYAVEQAAGTLIVSREQVIYVGPDLRTVYLHLQDSLPNPAEADDHVDLARWCIGYKLIPEARFELEAALETDPGRDDIRRNLNKLDALLNRPPPETQRPKAETPAERFARGAAEYGVEVESLGGLSREAGQEFTRRIQPILMHNCTNSKCHGPLSDNKFKLTLVREASVVSRSTTEKNLLALLPYIDRQHAKSGQLWKLLKTNHGAQGGSIFLGQKGKDQLTACQTWLLSLADGSEEEEPLRVTSKRDGSKIQQTGHTAERNPRWRKGGPAPATKGVPDEDAPPAPEVLVTSGQPAKGTSQRSSRAKPNSPSSTSPRTIAKSEGPEVEPIVSAERPAEIPDLPAEDPFNPDEFNRRQKIKRTVGQ